MFEALNTTGEPLTAFETLKPKIIEAESLEHYQGSASHKDVQRIEVYLDAFKKADDRQRATSELLIPMALAETGDRLQKNLSDQRRYLRDYFDGLPSLDDKRGVVGSLANLTDFVRTGWQSVEDEPALEAFGKFDQEAGFCFQSLRQLKHVIAIAPLSRFYDQYRRSDDATRAQRRQDLITAIKATTAFSMLWRGGHGGTENIDGVYRAVMREGASDQGIPPLARQTDKQQGVVSVNNYRRLLWSRFLKSFSDKDAWIKAASRVPIYDHSAVVTKFLLIVASDDAAADPLDPVLLVRGTKGLAPTIRTDAWDSASHYSVEHIAPQSSKANGWKEGLYDDPGTINRIGNLILLPGEPNSYIGKRPWDHKKLIYKYLCAETAAEAGTIAGTFGSAGLTLGLNGEKILTGTGYLPMCKGISKCTEEWDVDIVDRRSNRLAELAYERVIDWLKV
ncbi:hypothetical protein Rumeso_00881 [Rubellimicrobium mesophilum DSM 19309]|uniref:GmrSD restriction endonucleases C-terminal domain-containing protein n=2 Tax=Rubellimicrobium TaxID=295418 RepID=A0A017HSV0_9RHOB|nr:hypothetical protein Rumeso_00881 [Rubellimicrobium mesophilum DSM 19309]